MLFYKRYLSIINLY